MLLSHLKSFVSYISAGLTQLSSHFSDIILDLSTRHSLSDKALEPREPDAHRLSIIHSFILSHFRNLLFCQMPGTMLGPGNTKRKYRCFGLKNNFTSENESIVFPGTSLLLSVYYLQFTKLPVLFLFILFIFF